MKKSCIDSNSLPVTPSTFCDSTSFKLSFSSSFSGSFPELAESYYSTQDDDELTDEKERDVKMLAVTNNYSHQQQVQISKDRTPTNLLGSKSKSKKTKSRGLQPRNKKQRESGETKSTTSEQEKKSTGRHDKKHISRANNLSAKKEQDLQNAIDKLLETSSSTAITMTSSSSSSSSSSSFQRKKTKPTRHTKAYANRMKRSSLDNDQSKISSSNEKATNKHVSWEDNDHRCDRIRNHKLVRNRSHRPYPSERNPPRKMQRPLSREKLNLEVKTLRHRGAPNHDGKTKKHNEEETTNENNTIERPTSSVENENKDASSRRLLSEQQPCSFFFENLWDEENDMAPPSFYDTDKPMGKKPSEQMNRLSSSFENLFYNENSKLRPSKDKSRILAKKGSETKKKKSNGKKKTKVHYSESTKQSSKSSSTSKREPNVLTAHPQKPHGARKKNRRRWSSTFGRLHFLRSLRG